MTGKVGIGHPKLWVVMRNAKDKMPSSIVDHARAVTVILLYFGGKSTEAQRDVETSWGKSIRI